MERVHIANIELAEGVSENSNYYADLVQRLDDGNDFPGYEVERVGEGEYELYSVE